MNKHILSILVNNNFGVLTRVAGLFARRGYNIDSLSVGRTENEKYSRITIALIGDDDVTNQVKKQLSKLYDVKNVVELKGETSVVREMVIIKVAAISSFRSNISSITDIFRARIIDISKETLTLELTGNTNKINAFIEMLNEYEIIEIVRTGLSGIERGTKNIYDFDECEEEENEE